MRFYVVSLEEGSCFKTKKYNEIFLNKVIIDTLVHFAKLDKPVDVLVSASGSEISILHTR